MPGRYSTAGVCLEEPRAQVVGDGCQVIVIPMKVLLKSFGKKQASKPDKQASQSLLTS